MTKGSLFYFMTILIVNVYSIENYCWSTDPVKSQVYNDFASKTAYQFVRGNVKHHSNIPYCTPKKIWLFTRHGTRLPSAGQIFRMEKLPFLRDYVLHNKFKKRMPIVGGLCDEDLELLKEWKWNKNITVEHEEFLVEQGWNDLKWLAQSYQEAFPKLLSKKYIKEKYLFRSTRTQRTKASFKGFISGLFGRNSTWNFSAPPFIFDDYLLIPQSTCPNWIAHLKTYNADGTQPDLFRKSAPYKKLIHDVSKRLGFTKKLKGKQIRVMYHICRFEQAWFLNKSSTWCAAFTPSQQEVLNFEQDIISFYKTGYGADVNKYIACDLVNDLIKRIDSPDEQNTIYFSHSTTLYLLFVALGLNIDPVPITSSRFTELLHSRKWLTTKICPFAANLGFIKYHCPSDNVPEKVLILHNERPLLLDWCVNGFCDWPEFKKRYNLFTTGKCKDIYCPK